MNKAGGFTFLLLFATVFAHGCFSKSQNIQDSEFVTTGNVPETIEDMTYWSGWRHGPISFPDHISPLIPETLESGEIIDFESTGENVVVISPSGFKGEKNAQAIEKAARWISKKCGHKSGLQIADSFNDLRLNKHLILLGTPDTNAVARKFLEILKINNFLDDAGTKGYRIKIFDNPFNDKKIIFALANTEIPAWQSAIVVYFAIHKARVGNLENWDQEFPNTNFILPFEASFSGGNPAEKKTEVNDIKEVPALPYGVRIWGSPTPSLETFKRMITALKSADINSIIIQIGGWPDLKYPAEVCYKAVDIAYKNGIYVYLYVGNEIKAHHVAKLSEKHIAIIEKVKHHPGLLGWKLYNQLTDRLSSEERMLLEKQIKYIKNTSSKPAGIEIVWGHNMTEAPEHKVSLIKDVLSWGLDNISHDYAPIGGWCKDADISRWEKRLLSIKEYEPRPVAILQAHVPFLEPEIPTAEQMRNQFWWALVGGAKGFFFETAYNYNHFSNRGFLTWNLKPVSDGRFEELARLAIISSKLRGIIFELDVEKRTELPEFKSLSSECEFRIFEIDNSKYLFIINPDLDKPAEYKFTLDRRRISKKPLDVITGQQLDFNEQAGYFRISILPGDGCCVELNEK